MNEDIKNMSKNLPENTIVIISADHGHKDIEKVYKLSDYPEIQECLILPTSLESRCITFWVKENMKKEFEKRFNNIFKDEFILITKEEFLEKHYLGYGKKHPKKENTKKSTHCGLTKEEMEVPLIVIEK